MEQARPLAEKCVQYCADLIFRIPKHRMHGTWFVCRSTITRALLIVGGARSRHLNLPDRWREALETARNILRRYKHEAPDLEQAFGVLDLLVSSTLDQLW